MASLVKPWFTSPLPTGAEVVTRGGVPHVRVVTRGRAAYHPLARG